MMAPMQLGFARVRRLPLVLFVILYTVVTGGPLLWVATMSLRTTIVNLLVLSFIGKMMVFDLIWVMTGGGPLWSTETVSTYVYKRAFEWNTFDLGYPSAIAVLWFIIILAFIAIMTRLLRQRDRLEF